MRKQEEIIKEKRTLEANRKNLMGSNGKLGVIVKNLGQPMISHDIDQTFLQIDPYELPDENEIPIVNFGEGLNDRPNSNEWADAPDPEYINLSCGGFYFDGLSRGMHLEIKLNSHDNELTARYEGYLVYRELSNELMAYFPMDEWEDKIDRLYNLCKPIERENQRVEKEERKEQIKKEKFKFLKKMREKWGI